MRLFSDLLQILYIIWHANVGTPSNFFEFLPLWRINNELVESHYDIVML